MHCKECGNKIIKDDQYCSNCGAEQPSEINTEGRHKHSQLANPIQSESDYLRHHTDKTKILIPISILIGAILIAGVYFGIEYNKQKSIERQQEAKMREDKAQKDADNARAELKLKQDECEALASGVKKRWYNVMGVTYDNDFWKQCVVTYTDTKTGQVETAPLSSMQDN